MDSIFQICAHCKFSDFAVNFQTLSAGGPSISALSIVCVKDLSDNTTAFSLDNERCLRPIYA